MWKQVYIGTLLIHDIDNQPYSWLVFQDGIDGIGEVPNRLSAYDAPGEDGGRVSNSLRGMREFSLNGQLHVPSDELYEKMRRDILMACRTKRDNYGRPIPVRITMISVGGSSYFIDAFPRTPRLTDNNIRKSDFYLPFTAPDPTIYRTGLITSDPISRPTGGGIQLPVRLPFSIGANFGGRTVITNTGSSNVWPIITLNGALNNPTVRHEASGRYFGINYTMTTNDKVVIDMKERTITLNDSSSLLANKSFGSEWFSLDVDNNNLIFTTTSGSDTGTMTVGYYIGYIAI